MVSDRIHTDRASNDAVVGGVATGALVRGSGGSGGAAIATGLAAGLGAMAFNANTKDNYYVVRVDIKITETRQNRTHDTTLTVVVNRVNLTVEEATEAAKTAIAASLSGLF